MNFARSFGLTQRINESTRITNTSQTIIDIIFVNNEHRIINSGVIPISISDHSFVYCSLKSGLRKATPKIIEYRSYKYFNVDSFKADLKHAPWHVIENEE